MKIQRSFKNNKNSFYIIPTPIGNLEDITLRALNILKSLDILYCEDKRVTQKLLSHFDIKVKLYTYNEFSFEKESTNILNHLNEGLNIGLVSDAGMPGISDPGYKIIDFLKSEDQNVVILPGAVAYILPQVYASINEKPFVFHGFLSKTNAKYKSQIQSILNQENNVILYESPHRISKTINEINKINEDTKIVLARELTKIFEEYIQGDVKEISEYLENTKLKGEIVLIISPMKNKEEVDYLKVVDKLLNEGYSKKDAVKEVATIYNISKNKLYNKVINK